MFVTRATRHDLADVKAFYSGEDSHPGWAETDVSRGTVFVARDGGIVGSLILRELEPQKIAVDAVLVKADRRGEGIGARLMQAAMNSRGGTLYLCAHPERLPFYERLGFEQLPFEELPTSAQEYFKAEGDYPDSPEHRHYFMKAR